LPRSIVSSSHSRSASAASAARSVPKAAPVSNAARVPGSGRAPRAVDRVLVELRRHAEAGAPGGAMPSVRELITELGVSPVTVSRALSELTRQGVVVTRPGAGTFIAERPRPQPRSSFDWQVVTLGAAPVVSELELLVGEAAPRSLVLNNGYMDASLQPAAELARAARRVLAGPGAWGRAPLDGLLELRTWFATQAAPDVRASDVLLVQGGQAAIGTALRAVGKPGDSVLVESPTYLGATAALRAAGLRPVPVPTDERGLRVDFLDAAFASTGARVLYVQPCFSNPTGTILAPERQAEVLRLARQHNAFIIEDDYCRDLAYRENDSRSLLSQDSNGQVIYIRSLTKSIAPSMRVAPIRRSSPAVDTSTPIRR